MTGVLVDSNIILDILLDDPNWADWSETALADASRCAWHGFDHQRCG